MRRVRRPDSSSRGIAATLALCAALASTPAAAVTTCTATVSTASFGTYSTFSSSPNETTADIAVACLYVGVGTTTVSYTMKLSAGTAGTFSPRAMAGALGSLQYNFFTSGSYATVWGDGTGSTGTVGDSYTAGTSLITKHYTVYGRIAAQQNARPGVYTDAILVTVDY